MSFQVYHLFSQTILHCGAGQSVSIVDQPIARARASNLPIVPGSTMRGVLKAHVNQIEQLLCIPFFGHDKASSESPAGALSITDAHLLLFPVRAVYGILAYATCPFILQRYKKDLNIELNVPNPTAQQACCGDGNLNQQDNKIILEDLDLETKFCPDTQAWAKHFAGIAHASDSDGFDDMSKRVIVLPDTVFAFLAETATEIRTRIRINQDTGVVDKGALWTEESLPAETLLWGVYGVDTTRSNPEQRKQFNQLLGHQPLLQMGGNMGTGNGLVQLLTGQNTGDQ